jgi:ribonuclease III
MHNPRGAAVFEGHAFADGSLLTQALSHRSAGSPHNERLEFLGDALLNLIVAEQLYLRWPKADEGAMTRARAELVRESALAGVARNLDLGPRLILGPGEMKTGGHRRDSILADAVEALIGAIHLGCGLDAAGSVIHRLFDPMLVEASTRGAGLDWKTSLQELGAARGLGAPTYQVEDDGPDHAKTFTAAVLLAGAVYGRGRGRTKKAAEQEAAEAAWRSLSSEG